jgi:hypothetical protein
MTTVSTKNLGLISKAQTRRLLSIDSQDTINSYFREFGFSEREFINWNELKNILKLKMFLGIKPGVTSKQMFHEHTPEQIDQILIDNGMDINAVFERVQTEYHKLFNT